MSVTVVPLPDRSVTMITSPSAMIATKEAVIVVHLRMAEWTLGELSENGIVMILANPIQWPAR